MNWIKSYWSNCIAITAIICSVVAICVSLPSKESIGIDYIGVIIGILSFLVTMLMGWQIWNAVSIDKKIKEEIELAKTSLIESINKTKEDLSISGVKSTVATLYKVESTYLNVCLLAGDYKNGISTLHIMLEYAISLSDSETLNNFAKSLVDSKNGFCNRVLTKQDYEIIYNSFLPLFQSVLIHLPASDNQVPRIFQMINDIHDCMSEWKKTT